MSETINTPETDFQTPAEDPTPTPEPTKEPEVFAEHSPESETQDDADTEEAASTSSEAAKYRKRAQTAESEAATLEAELNHLHRGQVSRIIGNTPSHGNAALLWAAGITPAELLDEAGQISKDATLDAYTRALAHFGLIKTTPRATRIPRGMPRGGSAPDLERKPATWNTALNS